MIFFSCVLPHKEINNVKKALNAACYCLFEMSETGGQFGVIEEDALDALIDAISGEALQNLEYLDASEFKQRLDYRNEVIAGTDSLLQHLSFSSSGRMNDLKPNI